MPLTTSKATIKSAILNLNSTMKASEMSDNDYADAMADIIKGAVDSATGTGTATAGGLLLDSTAAPCTGTAPVTI